MFVSNSLPPGCEFGQADMQKLVPKEEKPSGSNVAATASGSRRAGNESIWLYPTKTAVSIHAPGWVLTFVTVPTFFPPLSIAESEAVSVDSSAGGLLEGMGLDGDSLAPMETDEPTATDPKAKSKLTPAMATRIKQIKPLLSGE